MPSSPPRERAGEPVTDPPIVSIVGRTDSGKTTLIERLLPALGRRGWRVATVKHHHHGDFEADTPGKDSWRHQRAGAVATALVGSHRLALFARLERPPALEEIVRRCFPERPDLVLTEGYRDAGFPKIEVVRAALGQPPLCQGESSLIALVTDTGWDLGVPRFALDDAEAVADFLLARVAPGGRPA